MGTLLDLRPRLADRSRPSAGARPAFFFDLGCALSYLAVERAERLLGYVEWIPASADRLRRGPGGVAGPAERAQLERVAAELRLPLVWPERFPARPVRALRVAAYAGEVGAGGRFALAASRLAFCGGFDLEDPEVLAEAAAAARLPLDACFEEAADPARDVQIEATADGLRRRGVERLPVTRVGGQWFAGQYGLIAAAARLRTGTERLDPVAPAG